jgi:hypothetical protein
VHEELGVAVYGDAAARRRTSGHDVPRLRFG